MHDEKRDTDSRERKKEKKERKIERERERGGRERERKWGISIKSRRERKLALVGRDHSFR